jgi:protein SCO1
MIARMIALIALALTAAFAGPGASAQPAAAAAQASGGRWHGEFFPNVTLTTQDGQRVRFYDDLLRGKTVAINFIYTNCPDVCPVDTAKLRQVQDLLGDRMGRDFHFYSISVDPEHDTPAQLRRFMQLYNVGPGWTFLTGRRQDIEMIQQRLAFVVGQNLAGHETSILFGNERTSQWIKRTPYDNPRVLANLLCVNLSNNVRCGQTHDYGEAQASRQPPPGATLFQTRCASCHSIGEGDRLGPDLRHVASSRPRDWLTRWIMEPDKMIQERDPTAMALMARYRNLPMPNLSLTRTDAANIIAYLEQRDAELGPAHVHGGGN